MLDQFRDPLAVLSLVLIGIAVFGIFIYFFFKGQEPGSFVLAIIIGIANLLFPWWLFQGPYLKFSEPAVKMAAFFGILLINIVVTNALIVRVVKYDDKEKKEVIDILLAGFAVVLSGISAFFLYTFFMQKVFTP